MKRIAAVLILAILAGCASETEYGKCIGAFDEKNPKLEYKLSIRNAVVGVIFFGLVLPPIFVIADETFCPIGKK